MLIFYNLKKLILIVFQLLQCGPMEYGIPELLDSEHKCWTLVSGRWTLNARLCTMDFARWILDAGL